MVGAAGFPIGDGTAKAVRPETHIGIGEQNPLGVVCCAATTWREVSQPSGRQFAEIWSTRNAGISGMIGRDAIEDLFGGIDGAIVNRNHLVIGVLRFRTDRRAASTFSSSLRAGTMILKWGTLPAPRPVCLSVGVPILACDDGQGGHPGKAREHGLARRPQRTRPVNQKNPSQRSCELIFHEQEGRV